MTPIILASASPFRAQMLRNAAIGFRAERANINERAVEAPLVEAGFAPDAIAEMLAIAKAQDVSMREPGRYVIGSDQVLSLEDRILHKPENMEEARRRLLELSGRTHHLNTAVAIVLDSEILWSHVEIAAITFRKLSPQFVGRHLAMAGEKVLQSVGAYQIEAEGVQLFERIEGDFFTIMGMPLLPLLARMREYGLVDG